MILIDRILISCMLIGIFMLRDIFRFGSIRHRMGILINFEKL